MIWQIKNRKRKDKTVWHPWFAWHPVCVYKSDYVFTWTWLEKIQRKGYRNFHKVDAWEGYHVWEYEYKFLENS